GVRREFLPVPNAAELVFSPDGRQLLVRSPEGVKLWDVALKRASDLPLEKGAEVKRMQFRPDGRQFLLIGDGSAWLWPNFTATNRTAVMRQWVEATCGARLGPLGEVEALSDRERDERRKEVEAQTGISELRAAQ